MSLILGIVLGSVPIGLAGPLALGSALFQLSSERFPAGWRNAAPVLASAIAVLLVTWVLAEGWMPLGLEKGLFRNLLFVAIFVGGALAFSRLFERFYGAVLGWCLDHKAAFLSLIALLVLMGASSWLGFERVFGFIPRGLAVLGFKENWIRLNQPWVSAKHAFPGLGREFMPALDEGSFLYMPSALPHASLGESLDFLSKQNQLISAIPEIDSAVGKIGRVESALDPAPIGMVETVIQYKTEYITDVQGYPRRFRYDARAGGFERDASGALIPDPDGRPYRQWRDHVRTPDDIWNEIVDAAQIPGATGVSKLQPIETRRVMLQSGIRARMAVEVKGDNLEVIGDLVLRIEQLLRSGEIPGVKVQSVIADRIVGKPYLEIRLDRHALARFPMFGVNLRDLFQYHQINLSVAIWVGFLALFGIASDDGVVIATYLRQSFAARQTTTIAAMRQATLAAGLRRIRPCLMTSATTILALLPVMTSTGRGADIMIPMAIPIFGGMTLAYLTMFTVPVLHCLTEEWRLNSANADAKL